MRSAVRPCLLVLVWSSAVLMQAQAASMMKDADRKKYLMAYGFMGSRNPDPEIAELMQSDEAMALKVGTKMFQMKYAQYGLEATGEMDNATSVLMGKSRCGVEDINSMEDIPGDMMGDGATRRKKRFTYLGGTWPKTDITYSLDLPTDEEISAAKIKSEIQRAFMVWEMVSPLRFREVSTTTKADIPIRFGRGDHQDNYPFDGPSGTLAHAFAPTFGQAHFDKDETWSADTTNGINFFQVAVHEFGHSLGLGHSEFPDALMAPFYQGYQPNFQLHSDDIAGIQSRYGPPLATQPGGQPMPTTAIVYNPGAMPTGNPNNMPTVCAERRVDAMTEHVDSADKRVVYAFGGDEYLAVGPEGILDGYPRAIVDDWPQAQPDIDAALTIPPTYQYHWSWKGFNVGWELEQTIDQQAITFLFKGNNFWEYDSSLKLMNSGSISSRFIGLTGPIDASFVWSGNGRIYIFKGSDYYRVDATRDQLRVARNYPRPTRVWAGVPTTVDDAFSMRHFEGGMHYDATYFVSGDKVYRFMDSDFKTSQETDSLTEDALRCRSFEAFQHTNDGNAESSTHMTTHLLLLAAIVITGILSW